MTASRRKLRIFLPNFRSASSAASSAFSISFSRFAASVRNREMRPSDSRSASLSVRSLLVVVPVESAPDGSVLPEAVAAPLVVEAWLVDIDRVRLTMVDLRSVKPLSAPPPTTEASWRAPS